MAVDSKDTPATEIMFERITAKIENDEFDYPNDVCFMAADTPRFGEMMRRSLLKEQPIVVVYPDGTECLIPAVTARRPGS